MASSGSEVAAERSPRIALFDRGERAVPESGPGGCIAAANLHDLLWEEIGVKSEGYQPGLARLGMTLAGHRPDPRDHLSGPCHHIFFTSSPRYKFANVLFSIPEGPVAQDFGGARSPRASSEIGLWTISESRTNTIVWRGILVTLTPCGPR